MNAVIATETTTLFCYLLRAVRGQGFCDSRNQEERESMGARQRYALKSRGSVRTNRVAKRSAQEDGLNTRGIGSPRRAESK